METQVVCQFGEVHFWHDQVQYLGYIIDERGVHVDPTKIQVIWDWPAPTTLIELHNFLGLANFYRRFMLGFSHITWPLSQVTKGGAKEKFFWSESQQKAFVELKHHLCCAPILTLPDLQQPFEIETDASDYAIGEVLTQQGHPVAYHSATLSESIPLMTKKCIPLCRLATMEALHFGEGNDHPHRPPTPIVHTDTREVAE
jgi:hypothetical protein